MRSAKEESKWNDLANGDARLVTEGDVQRAAVRLLRYGATLGRLAEEQCNGYQDWRGNWNEKATKRAEAKEARIEKRVIALCEEIGVKADFQGDPRGHVVKIITADHREFGVPTS